MPIDYSKYHPKWKKISLFIRQHRAKNKCEWCGVPNGEIICRTPYSWYLPTIDTRDFIKVHGIKEYNKWMKDNGLPEYYVKIILTVAHLDRNRNNNSFFNLAALCQKCHLNHDRSQHIRNRKYGRYHKEKQLEINFNHEK